MSKLLFFLPDFFQHQDSDSFIMFWAKEILGALIILAFFLLLSKLCMIFFNWIGKKIATSTDKTLDDNSLGRTLPYFSKFLTVLGVHLSLRFIPLHDTLIRVISGTLFIILVIMFCKLIYYMFDELFNWYISKRQNDSEALISKSLLPVIEKLLTLVLIGFGAVVILKRFHYDIFSLLTAFGIGSLAVGMAAKDTLANMISGFTLMIDRPFHIGDRIQLANGNLGNVTEIGLRTTKIKTLDNQQLIIPNSDLCNTTLINHAFPDTKAKGRINIDVAYGSDVEKVKAVLVATALEISDVLAEPVPESFFVSFGESALHMSLFFWVAEYQTLFATTDKINSLIVRRFAENDIEIPFPVRTVIMGKGNS